MLLHTIEAVFSWGASSPLLHITPGCFSHSFPYVIHIPPEMVKNPVWKIVFNLQFNAKHDKNLSPVTYSRLLNENMPNGLPCIAN